MNFAVNRSHRDFFRKHRWIELEELLAPKQLDLLDKEIAAVLSKRLKKAISSFSDLHASEGFDFGRDLWRESIALKKALLHRNLAEVASELIELKPLRFGYDQLFLSPKNLAFKNQYTSFLEQTPTLQEISCIQGVLGGLMLCLSHPQGKTAEADAAPTLFSTHAGNGVFFAPDAPIPFNELSRCPSGSAYLMLVYTQANAVYCVQEKDPHLHDFKRFGYNFGDRLTEVLNPLVYG